MGNSMEVSQGLSVGSTPRGVLRTDKHCALGKISKSGDKVCTQGDSNQYPADATCEGVPIQPAAEGGKSK
ncbi:unnamed protein product [Ectocarpus sp. CCAP 1310/34]|nr:unnamed protein product [Ectocarpus sp. CCAP 1310/34]